MILAGSELEGKEIQAWFYPIKMKPFKANARVLKFNSNWKGLKYQVKLLNGTKHKIKHNQIIQIL